MTEDLWKITPSTKLGATFAFGDLEANTQTKAHGYTRSTDLVLENVNPVTFNGGLGIKTETNNFSFGLNYDLNLSEHEVSHGIFAEIKLEF